MKSIALWGRHTLNGLWVIVDDDDFDYLNQWTWNTTPKGYATRTDRSNGKKTVYMHIEVAKRAGIYEAGKQVDHRNLRKWDNQRNNLRPATNQQNQANVGPSKNNTSGVKGVRFRNGRWIARIGVNYQRVQIGVFDTAEEAGAAYEAAARQYFGDFAKA